MGTSAKRQAAPALEQTGDSRTAILSAALQVFASDGYDGASLPRIARIAQVAPPLIHYHFGNKEKLWRETIDFSLGSLLREATVIRDATRSLAALDRLRALIEAFTVFAARFPDQFSLIIAEARSQSDRFAWVNERYTSPLFGFVVAALQDGQRAGVLLEVDAQNLATMMIGAIFTRFTVGTQHAPEAELRALAEAYTGELFDIFIDGARAR